MFFVCNEFVNEAADHIQHLRIALLQLRSDVVFDFDLWIGIFVVHHEIIHTLIKINADLKEQFQRNADFSVFQIADVGGSTAVMLRQFFLRDLFRFPSCADSFADQGTV